MMPAGLLLWALVAPGGAGAPAARASDRQFVVVASHDVPVDGLSVEELRRIFLFRKTMWSSRQSVRVLLPEAGLPAREYLLEHVYNTNDHGLKRLVLEKLFQGELDLAPKVVISDDEALSFVRSARGLIALVNGHSEGVSRARVLRIGGKLPGEAGYPLQE